MKIKLNSGPILNNVAGINPEHVSFGVLRIKNPNNQTSGLYNFTLTYEKNRKNETFSMGLNITFTKSNTNALNWSYEISLTTFLIFLYVFN